MQFRVFTLPAEGSLEQEEELNAFLRGQRIVGVHRSLENGPGGPRWCFCVEYLEGGRTQGARRPGGKSRRVDYREVLSEDDFAVFARLRDVRKELAAREAVPAYAVCTNEMLADVARRRPQSLEGLRETEGFGQAKVEKYGAALMEALGCPDPPCAGPAAPPDPPGFADEAAAAGVSDAPGR